MQPSEPDFLAVWIPHIISTLTDDNCYLKIRKVENKNNTNPKQRKKGGRNTDQQFFMNFETANNLHNQEIGNHMEFSDKLKQVEVEIWEMLHQVRYFKPSVSLLVF
jgi:hypothetical protein